MGGIGVNRQVGPWRGAVMVIVLAGAGFLVRAAEREAVSRPSGPWEKVIREFEAWDRKNAWPRDPVLFVGSSSIVRWATREHFPDWPVINRGFGGSQIADVNRYLDRVVLRYEPRVIVFYSGDNDIAAGKSPERVSRDYQAFVSRVRKELPHTRIVFVAIKPSTARWRLWPEMKEANGLIEAFSKKDPRLAFVDVASPMLDEAGKPRAELLAGDGLHMSEEGYRLWTRLVRAEIEAGVEKKRTDVE